jgi:hypothetical protein
MRVKASMYVCSKPLQYFNVRNLPKDEINKNILVIENKFKDAYKFYESVKMFDNSWNEIQYADDRSKVFFLCMFKYRVANLYYYLDFMLRAASMLYAIPAKDIYVYEEGISAYRTDIFKNTAGYKRKIRKLLGLSEYAGLHPRVKGMYVYCKEKYLKTFSSLTKRKLSPLNFNASFRQMINGNVNLALNVFNFNADKIFADVHNKKVLLYLTSWPLDENVLKHIENTEHDYFVIKPHPHIRELDFPNQWKNKNTIVINSVILAEFIIKILSDKNNLLDIYHHNSSAVMYLQGLPNIGSITSMKEHLGFIDFYT